LRLERCRWRQGFQRVGGVDEVGRGSLFGPVVAAAVILDPSREIRGLHDSKLLDPERREQLCVLIRERALAVSVAAIDSARIDRMNIYQASRCAMREAVLGMRPAADFLLLDALKIDVDVPQAAIIHGDARSRSIAAASIVAKVERDRWMRKWDAVFPQYRLASNKGYATADHLEALRQFGPTALHRHSFLPVALAARFPANLAPQQSLQIPLFNDALEDED
jgi:ribonuclease HII